MYVCFTATFTSFYKEQNLVDLMCEVLQEWDSQRLGHFNHRNLVEVCGRGEGHLVRIADDNDRRVFEKKVKGSSHFPVAVASYPPPPPLELLAMPLI